MTLRANSKPPYPVLSPATGDYEATSAYQAEFTVRRRIGRDITIAVRHQLASPGLQRLIAAEAAEFATQVKCQDTRVRSLHQSDEPTQTIVLNDQDYAGITTIQPLIVAKGAIDHYQAQDWSSRTKGLLPEGIFIPPAALLAAGDRHRFDVSQVPSGDSIVQLAPNDKMLPGEWDFDLDDDKIIIKVHPDTFKEIRELQANETIAAALWPSIYQSAIQHGIRFHRHEHYAAKRWAINIARSLREKLGNNLPDDDQVANHDLKYAQLVMDQPLSSLLQIQTHVEDQE